MWVIPSISRKDEGMQVPFDKDSSSIIKLNNATVLYLREVSRYLALVCILREDNFDRQGKYTLIYFWYLHTVVLLSVH